VNGATPPTFPARLSIQPSANRTLTGPCRNASPSQQCQTSPFGGLQAFARSYVAALRGTVMRFGSVSISNGPASLGH
jgi:hypothetical protein